MNRHRSLAAGAAPWTHAALAGGLTAGLLSLAALPSGIAAWPVIALTALWAAGEAAAAGLRGPETAANGAAGRMAHRLAGLTGLILLALVAVPLSQATGAPSLAPGWLAAGLMLAGATFRIAAILALGGRFNSDNAIADGAGLQEAGPYRLLAHPSELGLLLLAIGALAFVGHGLDWLWLIPLYGLQAVRIRLEEQSLLGHFGEAYRQYRRRRYDPLPSNLFKTRGA
ncbi:MAG: isoprenylcysteine carboxyl methyltransferase [Caulobacter sp.]|nr:isoprenylcysteine carboxyl methyltransferase [Caulobacter sp.]